MNMMQWHAHEMLFGFGGAVLIGFLLTASKNWVGVRGIHGKSLMFLSILWISERLFLFDIFKFPAPLKHFFLSLFFLFGGGLGTAIVGLLLDFSGFKGTLTVQPDSAINMLHIMYLIVPFALDLIITLILSKMNVEKANAEIKEKLGISENEVVMESQN
jgi:hypothetical protein